MRDGPIRRTLKLVLRAAYGFGLRVQRAVQARRGEIRYDLAGACQGCGRCCEWPSLQVGSALWHLPLARRALLAWQRHANGFEFVRAEREARVLVFRCGHYDSRTRTCDSYDSRPAICRDYPRVLLDQPWPEFFSECSHRPVARGGAALAEALGRAGLGEEKRAELKRKLHLE